MKFIAYLKKGRKNCLPSWIQVNFRPWETPVFEEKRMSAWFLQRRRTFIQLFTHFLRRLPVIVTLPKFQNRPQSERLRLIDSFFITESSILDKELQVSYQMIDFLLNSDLEGNVGKIKNIIKYACGNAYVHQKNSQTIFVRLKDLPLEYNLKFKEQFSKPKKKMSDRTYLPNTTQQIHLESKETQLLRNFLMKSYQNLKRSRRKRVSRKNSLRILLVVWHKWWTNLFFKERMKKRNHCIPCWLIIFDKHWIWCMRTTDLNRMGIGSFL